MITPLEIKTLILKISGLHGKPEDIKGSTTLEELGFNDAMCIKLENKINALRMPKAPVPPGSITPDSTVDEVIASAQL